MRVAALACCLAVGHGWASATCLIVYRTYASIMTGNVLSLATYVEAAGLTRGS